MAKILFSSNNKKLLAGLQAVLVEQHILATVHNHSTDRQCSTAYLLTVPDEQYELANEYIQSNQKKLGLPSVLWDQLKQRNAK